MKLSKIPVVVLVWTMEGCPACQEYIPIWRQVAAQYAGCIPSMVLDVNQNPKLADAMRVMSTPTTMIVRNGQRSFYYLGGAASAEEVQRLYEAAAWGMDCAV